MIKKLISLIIVSLIFNPAWAGLAPAQTALDKVLSTLVPLGAGSAAVMLVYAGFKIMYFGDSWKNHINIFIGAIIIGSATLIAQLFI